MIGTKEHVLVFADEAATRRMLSNILSEQGYNCDAVETINQARDVLHWRNPAIILFYVTQDPVFTLTEVRKSVPKHAQCLVLISAELSEPQSRQVESLADDFLYWPVSASVLVQGVVRNLKIHRLERDKERYMQLAIYDELTGTFNRRFFGIALKKELSRAVRNRQSLAVCLLDIDDFKHINDTYGHKVGDRVIQALVHQLKLALRQIDLLCRYGGDEFLLLLPDTHPDSATVVAARLRNLVARMSVPIDQLKQLRVTVSIGVAVAPQDSDQVDQLIHCADMAMYAAKREGKNRLSSWRPSDPILPVHPG